MRWSMRIWSIARQPLILSKGNQLKRDIGKGGHDMRRKLAFLLTLSLMLGVVGCTKTTPEETGDQSETTVTEETTATNDSQEVEEGSDVETTEEVGEEKQDAEKKVFVSFESKNDDRYNENGDLILYVYYTKPVITIEGNDEATQAIAEEIQTDEENFYINCEYMEQDAALIFDDESLEDMPPLADEVKYREKRVDNQVISLQKNEYTNVGGAHGNTYVSAWNFDVESGKRLTLEDITEDKDAFMAKVREYVLELCESDDYKDRLFPDYKDNIDLVLQDDLWFFDYEGITFISNTYELAAYAEGTLFFTIPYEVLEGLKPEYSYTGGFMKGVNLGEGINMDLNGDDTADEVVFDVEESSDYVQVPSLTINGVDYSKVFEDNQCYFDYPYNQYVILDIDSADENFEIAVQDYGMSDDPVTYFFRYDGEQVIYLGYICDRISDLYIVNHGDGTVSARELMGIFETVRIQVTYELDGDRLVRQMKDLYTVVYESGNTGKTVLRELTAYADMSLESEKISLSKDDKIKVLATDDVEWIQIEDANGTICYIHMAAFCTIDSDGTEVDIYDAFDPVILAG